MKTRPLPDLPAAQRLLGEITLGNPSGGPRRVDKPLVLYGAGKLGQLAADLFLRLDIPISFALDRQPPSNAHILENIPVLHPEQATEADRTQSLVAVCIVNAPYEPIRAFLAEMGWQDIVPVYDILEAYTDRIPMGNGWFAGKLDTEDQASLEAVLAGWHDDQSRAAHLQFLAWRVGREELLFPDAPVNISNRYFISPVVDALGQEEYFLDGGAYHGEISQQILGLLESRCRGILAIEPDPGNFLSLRKWHQELPPQKRNIVRLAETALGDEQGLVPFHESLGMASRIGSSANKRLKISKLDDLDFPVTFAKIHLEGGELKALFGARNILSGNRPVLAVTIYHNRDGLWRIPKHLMDTLQDYAFFMRLHAWCGTGAVLYAIPQERTLQPKK